MIDNAECTSCGITAADLPYEDLGLILAEASEFMFTYTDGQVLCPGCTA